MKTCFGDLRNPKTKNKNTISNSTLPLQQMRKSQLLVTMQNDSDYQVLKLSILPSLSEV